jgi:riboflavin-specific deaminase-like protein
MRKRLSKNERAPKRQGQGCRDPHFPGRPFILLNLAMSADGKITTASRGGESFSSPRDREHMLELRATVDAVMSGATTINAAAVTLGPGPAKYRRLRLKRGLEEYNLRVIVSGSGRIAPEAEIFRHRFSPLVILTTNKAGPGRIAALRKVADEVIICGRTRIGFLRAMQKLCRDWGVRRLLCEGGGELDDALFREDLVDELHLTVCPLILGGRDAPTIADGEGAKDLAAATRLQVASAQRFGDEMFFVFRRAAGSKRRKKLGTSD